MLTVLAIDKAKPRDKPYTLADGAGLHLFINPNGAKLWRFRFRFGGKANMLSFGSYPEVSLASAREKRDEARKLLASGASPAVKRKDDKRAQAFAAENTFGAAASDYIKKLEDEQRSPATLKKNRWLLEDLAAPLSPKPLSQIKAPEILVLLKSVEKQGFRETAHRLRGTIGRVFRFAIANLKTDADPTYALRGALLGKIVKHRAAITDEDDFAQLLRDLDAYTEARTTTKQALQFIVLTMCRPGEARLMRKSEVNWIKATWSIPAERMKMRREFQIPLSRQALAVLRQVWDTSQDYVFPSMKSPFKPMSDNTFNKALRLMGYTGDVQVAHGFRTSASTIMNERHMAAPDVIEVALSHQDHDEVRRTYNRAQYFRERTKLMQEWADLLDQLRGQSLQRARS